MGNTQRIIITGGAGFIGSHFLNHFVPLFPEVDFFCIDALTYAGNLDHIVPGVHTAPNFHFTPIDIREYESMRTWYRQHGPTDVIHFAAETHVDTSILSPTIFTETNVLGTQNLLNLHREFGLKRFHYISTDEVYGDIPVGECVSENAPFRPSSPYAASKAAADLLVASYGRTYGIDFVITRASNTYGTNQYPEKLIPFFIRQLQQGNQVSLYGDGGQIRDWIGVEDHIEAIWEVFSRACHGSIYNVGSGVGRTNREITQKILAHFGKTEEWIDFVTDRPGHDRRYASDISKIERELGWKPKRDFDATFSLLFSA